MRSIFVRRAVVGLVLGAQLVATSASAELWSDAKSAAMGHVVAGAGANALHKQAVEALMAHREKQPKAIPLLIAAVTALKLNGGATSPDPRLRYDLGAVLATLHECDAAIPVFHHALFVAPNHPQASRAWFELGLCHAHRGEPEDEEIAWMHAIELEDEPISRHVILANLAETRMRLGRLDEARQAIDEAIEIEPQNPVPHWTRALVLDRMDDRAGALTSARVALSLDPLGASLDSEGVFFVPPYDVHWYRGLVALAMAELSVGSAATNLRNEAKDQYAQWLAKAAPDDTFREIAARRIKQISAMK